MSDAHSPWLRRLVPLAASAAAIIALAIFWHGRGTPASTSSSSDRDEPEAYSSEITVKTIHPRRDPSFRMSVERPAYVDAYYQADLFSRVAGTVKSIDVNIGDRIKGGEELVHIDVPDLEEEVLQKDAVVGQRKKELALAQAFLKTAAAAVVIARALIPERNSDVTRAESVESFRGKELTRFKALAAGNSPGVTKDIVDERTQYYEAAIADTAAARASVQKANAGLSEAQAKLDAAQADVDLKSALVEVARKDYDRARATLSFATITSRFDGVITRRNVDPGSFVQNAATAHTEPMLTVARTDIMTVYMKVPDNYAPYVTQNTDAEIEIGVLHGLKIRSKVTRFSHSLKNPEHDRTMRVEVDVFNGTAAEYEQLEARAKATRYTGLKEQKLPAFPTVDGKRAQGLDGRLLQGMYGKMRLVLQNFDRAWLLPSTAIVHQGGRSFVCLVKDGKAERVPVEVSLDDGKLAKVSFIEQVNGQEVQRDLTGKEEVVASNQGELTDGQAVKATPDSW
jgi:multidrug efflux pump subunit AcrA (membrane-fusion protein)